MVRTLSTISLSLTQHCGYMHSLDSIARKSVQLDIDNLLCPYIVLYVENNCNITGEMKAAMQISGKITKEVSNK